MSDKLVNLLDPEEFIENLESLLSWHMEVVGNLQKVELSFRQKSQVVGMFMGVANQFVKVNEKLKEWGYIQ